MHFSLFACLSLALHFKRPIKHKKYHYQALLALAATHSSKGEQSGEGKRARRRRTKTDVKKLIYETTVA
jgi:hypothetical protein